MDFLQIQIKKRYFNDEFHVSLCIKLGCVGRFTVFFRQKSKAQENDVSGLGLCFFGFGLNPNFLVRVSFYNVSLVLMNFFHVKKQKQ